jgi:hypothetical protein
MRYLTVDEQSVWLGDKSVKLFKHDYPPSMIEHLNDSTYHDTIIYLQSLGGTQAILKIPTLEQLRQTLREESGNGTVVSVNKAELFIPALEDSAVIVNSYYPTQLGLRILYDEEEIIPDDVMLQSSQYVSSVTYMDARYDNSIRGYGFNLTAYFHEYFKGNINSSHLLLFAGRLDANVRSTNFNPVNYNRILLAGSSNINNRITLTVAYTKLLK